MRIIGRMMGLILALELIMFFGFVFISKPFFFVFGLMVHFFLAYVITKVGQRF